VKQPDSASAHAAAGICYDRVLEVLTGERISGEAFAGVVLLISSYGLLRERAGVETRLEQEAHAERILGHPLWRKP
jgi:hypothetical protein